MKTFFGSLVLLGMLGYVVLLFWAILQGKKEAEAVMVLGWVILAVTTVLSFLWSVLSR